MNYIKSVAICSIGPIIGSLWYYYNRCPEDPGYINLASRNLAQNTQHDMEDDIRSSLTLRNQEYNNYCKHNAYMITHSFLAGFNIILFPKCNWSNRLEIAYIFAVIIGNLYFVNLYNNKKKHIKLGMDFWDKDVLRLYSIYLRI